MLARVTIALGCASAGTGLEALGVGGALVAGVAIGLASLLLPFLENHLTRLEARVGELTVFLGITFALTIPTVATFLDSESPTNGFFATCAQVSATLLVALVVSERQARGERLSLGLVGLALTIALIYSLANSHYGSDNDRRLAAGLVVVGITMSAIAIFASNLRVDGPQERRKARAEAEAEAAALATRIAP